LNKTSVELAKPEPSYRKCHLYY